MFRHKHNKVLRPQPAGGADDLKHGTSSPSTDHLEVTFTTVDKHEPHKQSNRQQPPNIPWRIIKSNRSSSQCMEKIHSPGMHQTRPTKRNNTRNIQECYRRALQSRERDALRTHTHTHQLSPQGRQRLRSET